MLSYILGLAYQFEREHGATPSLLYLNQAHIRQLGGELDVSAVPQIAKRLGMAVTVSPDIAHPQLIHFGLPCRAACLH
jgi:hypothetical protein